MKQAVEPLRRLPVIMLVVLRSNPATPRSRRVKAEMLGQVFFVGQSGFLRHEISQIIVEREDTEILRHFKSLLHHVSSPFADHYAHDDQRHRHPEFASEIEERSNTFLCLLKSSATSDPVVRLFITVNREDESQILYP